MFNHDIETLTDDQLELVAGGIDGMGNIPTCPNLPPVHGPVSGSLPRGPSCGPDVGPWVLM